MLYCCLSLEDGEVYDGTSWKMLPDCKVAPMLTADRQGEYPTKIHHSLRDMSFGGQQTKVVCTSFVGATGCSCYAVSWAMLLIYLLALSSPCPAAASVQSDRV